MIDNSLKYYLQEFTPTQLRNMRPMSNNVIINIGPLNTMERKIKYGNLELLTDPDFRPEWNALVSGKVVKTPKSLSIGFQQGQMQWKTEVEIIPGDEVIFSFEEMLRVYKKMNTDMAFICREELYIIANYRSLYAAKRNTVPIMLNGYCLIEPMVFAEELERFKGLKKVEFGNLIVPDYLKTIKGRFGKVARIGKHNEYYLTDKEGERNYSESADDVRVGDIVWVAKNSDILLENPGHEKFIDGKQYYRVQRRRIEGVVLNEK